MNNSSKEDYLMYKKLDIKKVSADYYLRNKEEIKKNSASYHRRKKNKNILEPRDEYLKRWEFIYNENRKKIGFVHYDYRSAENDNRRETAGSNSGLVSYELSLQQEDATQIPPASPTALSSVTLSPRSFDETNTTGSNAAGNRTPEEAENPGGEGSSIPPPPMDDSSPNPKRSIGGMMKKLFGTRRKSNPDVSSDLPSFFPVPSASQKDDTQAAKSGLTHSKFLPSFSKKNRNGRDVEDPNQGGGSTPPSPSVQEEKDSNTEEAVVVEERIEEVEKEIIEEPNIEEPIPTPPLEDDTESPNTDISPHGNESSTNTTYDSWESGVQLTREEKQIQRVTSRLQSATSASPKGKVSPRASIPQAEGKKR